MKRFLVQAELVVEAKTPEEADQAVTDYLSFTTIDNPLTMWRTEPARGYIPGEFGVYEHGAN